MSCYFFSVIRKVNIDGTGLSTVGPPTFGRLNGLSAHKNGIGFTGMDCFSPLVMYCIIFTDVWFNF